MSRARDASADSPPAARLLTGLVSAGSLGFHHMLPTHLITSTSLLGACLHVPHQLLLLEGLVSLCQRQRLLQQLHD